MNKKTIIIAALVILVLFVAAVGISYKLTSKGSTNKEENNTINETKLHDEQNSVENNNNTEKKDLEYKEINKNSKIAQELYEFVPKSFQTYKNKMNSDYTIYEAITRLAKDSSVETVKVGEFDGYKYSDVDAKLKEIYGFQAETVKKDQYSSPIEYVEASDAFCVYPSGMDSTEDMQVLKSVEENDEMYKVTVYSVCVYVDILSSDFESVYIVTKDTMKKYYTSPIRDNTSIVSTYKKYELVSEQLDPSAVVSEMENDLPLIVYYLTKLDDRGTTYYVSDIVDVY